MKKIGLTVALTLLLCSQLGATTYFVATTGNDTTNPGTFELPFRTIVRAHTAVVAGDTILVRGGTYAHNQTINLTKVGTTGSKFYLLAYPGERPFFDFSSMPISSSLRGMVLSGQYWHVKGLDLFKAGDNGMLLRGNNNIVEFCSFIENNDTGLQLSNGASNNQVINCDSYYNADPGQGNADGFAAKLDVGTGNYFYGCRAWQNSDDGYDGYLRPSDDITTTLENCWIFRNGYLKSGLPSTGNGNGFKMGGSDNQALMHNVILKNCVAFDNRVKGFDQNNNKGSMTLYNCTAYRNGTNYSITAPLAAGKTLTLINCAAMGSFGLLGAFAIQQTNSWLPPFVVTADDWASLDTAGVRGPRNPDGSLPVLPFLRLAQGSDLIDAGTNVGIPYLGSAPDLGAFEYDGPSAVYQNSLVPERFHLAQNFPNPFNPSTEIAFSVAQTGWTRLEVVNLLGEHIAFLYDDVADGGRIYTIQFTPHDLSSGVYFYSLESGGTKATKKLVLMK